MLCYYPRTLEALPCRPATSKNVKNNPFLKKLVLYVASIHILEGDVALKLWVYKTTGIPSIPSIVRLPVDISQLPWGSQWGGGIYGYRLKFWLFYGYRLIFFSYG